MLGIKMALTPGADSLLHPSRQLRIHMCVNPLQHLYWFTFQLHQLLYPGISPLHAATLHLTPQPQPMMSGEPSPLPLKLYGLGLFLLLMLVFLGFHQSLAQQSAQILRLLLPPLH